MVEIVWEGSSLIWILAPSTIKGLQFKQFIIVEIREKFIELVFIIVANIKKYL